MDLFYSTPGRIFNILKEYIEYWDKNILLCFLSILKRSFTEAKERRPMFSDKIKQLRLQMGISQSELARRIGYSHEFISQVERGIKTPSIKALQKIATGLGVPASSLMESKQITPESEERLRDEVQRLVGRLPADKLKVIRDLLTVFPEERDHVSVITSIK